MVTHEIPTAARQDALTEFILTEKDLDEIAKEISRNYCLFYSLNEQWGPELPSLFTGLVEPHLADALRLDCLDVRDNFTNSEQSRTFGPILYHVRSTLFESLMGQPGSSCSISLLPTLTTSDDLIVHPRERLNVDLTKNSGNSCQLRLQYTITRKSEDPAVVSSVILSTVREIDTARDVANLSRGKIRTPDGSEWDTQSTLTIADTEDAAISFQMTLEHISETLFSSFQSQWKNAVSQQTAEHFVTKFVQTLPAAKNNHFEQYLALWESFSSDLRAALHTKIRAEYLPLTNLQDNLMKELCFASHDLLHLAALGPDIIQALGSNEIDKCLSLCNTRSNYLGQTDSFRDSGPLYRTRPVLHHLWTAIFRGLGAAQSQSIVLSLMELPPTLRWSEISVRSSGIFDEELFCEISYNGRKYKQQLARSLPNRENPKAPRGGSLAIATSFLFPNQPWRKVFQTQDAQLTLFKSIVSRFPDEGDVAYSYCRQLWDLLPGEVRVFLPNYLNNAYLK